MSISATTRATSTPCSSRSTTTRPACAPTSRRARTSSNDDRVGLVIDTFDDQRTGYGFRSSPLGVQWDGRWAEVGARRLRLLVRSRLVHRRAAHRRRLRRPDDDPVSRDALSRDARAALAHPVRAPDSARERGELLARVLADRRRQAESGRGAERRPRRLAGPQHPDHSVRVRAQLRRARPEPAGRPRLRRRHRGRDRPRRQSRAARQLRARHDLQPRLQPGRVRPAAGHRQRALRGAITPSGGRSSSRTPTTSRPRRRCWSRAASSIPRAASSSRACRASGASARC